MSLRRHDRSQSGTAWLIVFLLALGVGVFLRWYQLSSQILLDDEWHAIHELLHADAYTIATHFGLADYSIPLTLYYRFLYLHGGLSECGMRLPMLICGIALLIVAPWLLRRRASPATLVLWAGLMAISPLMVYHSRTARPYAITCLLTFVSIVAFREWWQRGDARWRWTMAYIGCTFLAGWLHLITLPFTLLPFIFFGVVALWNLIGPSRRQAWRDLGRLSLLGVLTAVPLVAALLPPIFDDWGALAGKAGSDSVTLGSAYQSALMCLGVGSPWLGAALLLLLACGAAAWWRRDAGFVAYIATIVVGSAVAMALSHPAWIQHPGTYARYLQPAVPFLLLFVAEGFASLIGKPAVVLQCGLVAALLVVLYFCGPIPGYLYNPNQFTGHPYFQFDYDPARNLYRTQLPDGPIPEFYRWLEALPPRSLTLIEAPWSLRTDHDPEQLYQHVHRQYVRIGLLAPVCGAEGYGGYSENSGMHLAQFVHLSALLRGDTERADFLVMHLHTWPSDLPLAEPWPDESACLARIGERFGAPVYRDDDIEVYALSAVARTALESAK